MLIFGDVHGCFYTFLDLLESINPSKDEKICFVGDLIDRGPRSKKIVEYVRLNGYDCVMGNHEDMAVKALNNEICELNGNSWEDIWMMNGGYKTVESMGADALDENYQFLSNLPTFLIYDDIKVNETPVIVTHSFLFSCGSLDDKFNIMWNRDFYIRDEFWELKPKYFNVFGHTPVKEVIIKDCYAMIDTGCVFKGKKDKLSAIRVENGMTSEDIQIFSKYYKN